MNELIEPDAEPEAFDFSGIPEPEVRALGRDEAAVLAILETQRRSTSASVVAIGGILEGSRERLVHRKGEGGFRSWVTARFGFSYRTAYRAIAARRVTASCDTVSQFLSPSALYLIAADECPDAARAEVLKLAGNGKAVSKKVAAAIVEKHRPAPEPKPKAAAKGGAGSRVENPGMIPGDAGQDTDRQGNGVSSAPVPAPPPAANVIETTARTVTPAEPTAVDILKALSPINNQLRKVKEDLNGAAVDGKELARHVVCVVDALNGETPAYRLVKAGDAAGQAAEIFDAYPRKVARDKALVAIRNALKRKPFDELLSAVKEYARSREGKDPQFTPHPATWFGEGRWDDDRSEWFRPESGGRGSAPRGPSSGERHDPDRGPVTL